MMTVPNTNTPQRRSKSTTTKAKATTSSILRLLPLASSILVLLLLCSHGVAASSSSSSTPRTPRSTSKSKTQLILDETHVRIEHHKHQIHQQRSRISKIVWSSNWTRRKKQKQRKRQQKKYMKYQQYIQQQQQQQQQQQFLVLTKSKHHHHHQQQQRSQSQQVQQQQQHVNVDQKKKNMKMNMMKTMTTRSLEDYYNDDDDDGYSYQNPNAGDDDANNNNYNADDDAIDNDDDNDEYDNDDEATSFADERCSQFLVSFLEGTTDAHDTCEGIMNAYTAAACSQVEDSQYNSNHDYDDYFNEFTEHECCQALIAHHSAYCEEDRLVSNLHLFISAAVLLLCESAKAVVHYWDWHFLPEAATCILVGTCCGLLAHLIPFMNVDEISFDDELFLSVLLPPIILEAALSVSKVEFKRRRGAIFMFSVFGTIISTFSTGLMVHYGSKASSAMTFPMLDSLVFGALISSIDPVAILSVLTSLKLDQKDTIFILVFGESLLNDGIAITVFQTLVDRFDGKTNDGTTSVDEILDAIATFLIAMFGSIAVGIFCGACALNYFDLLGRNLPPVMEVGSFFLWALIPYYICDGIGWSGIVSIVAVGFFMDIYIAGPKYDKASGERTPSNSHKDPPPVPSNVRIPASRMATLSQHKLPAYDPSDYYMDLCDHPRSHQHQQQHQPNNVFGPYANHHHTTNPMTPVVHPHHHHGLSQRRLALSPTFGTLEESHVGSIGPLPSTERIRLSSTADRHVRFVAHLTSQLAENAIFAYLGLFLFSQNYDWDPTLVTISIIACVLSRTFMIVLVSFVILQIYRCRGYGPKGVKGTTHSSRTASAIQDPRTQAVLILAGLRGAVSLALVENVPIYNNVSGEGCEFKPLMKGMASASILFTTFVFGGGAYYILPLLGINPDDADKALHNIHGNDTAMGIVTPDNMEFYIEATTQHENRRNRMDSSMNSVTSETEDRVMLASLSLPMEDSPPRVI